MIRSRKSSRFASIIKNRYLYLMLIPGLLYFLIYRYLPMYGLSIAFKGFRLSRGIWRSPWVGLLNFERFFSSPFFSMVISNTIIISLLKILIGFPIPIILALMLNEVTHSWYKKIIQTTSYLPHFLSWVVIGCLVTTLFAPKTGVLTNLIQQITGLELDILMDAKYFRGTLVLTAIWKEMGWGSIIYLAALAGVNPNLYEAASIDGANRYQKIVHITIPSIIPVVVIMFILRLANILEAGFEQIFVMQNPLVYEVSEVLDTYTYKVAFEQGQYAIATVVGLLKSVIGFFLVIGANRLTRKKGEGGALW